MRLDKFLKVSRIIKRRTLAKEVCDRGKVKINGRVAKAGSVVASGDDLEIDFGHRIVSFKVNRIASHATKEDASSMYSVVDEKQVL